MGARDGPQSEALYEDDPYGGWKGVRTTSEAQAWRDAGELLSVSDVNVSQNCIFFRAFPCTSGLDSSKPAVLMLPGFGATSYSFKDVLSAVSEHSHAAALDFLGTGNSDKPTSASAYCMGSYLAQVSAAISKLVELCHERCPSQSDQRRPQLCIVAHGYLAAPLAMHLATASNFEVALRPTQLVLLSAPLHLSWLSSATSPLSKAPIAARGAQAPFEVPRSVRGLLQPLLGAVRASNPAYVVDTLLRSSGRWVPPERTLSALREPFLSDGAAAFALRALAQDVFVQNSASQLARSAETFCAAMRAASDGDGDCALHKVLFVYGAEDRWIETSNALADALAAVMEERKTKSAAAVEKM